ncbi:unnamed protein product [Darwinula stevensoni]|uniref:C-type lectin domain-containing protein n=1 Tax=Darwinula stevensoni TaxID=69355 RepID=A0A7R9AEI4_9CRUS|nr:unnamed protein product [Darwinula stevensoni]CAG0902027.1 unnamed protein product [Darwinula stevensoni]
MQIGACEKTYYRAVSVVMDKEEQNYCPKEFIDILTPAGLPPHESIISPHFKAWPENKSRNLYINMSGIPCLLFALILLTEHGSGNALESTPIHGGDIRGNLEEMVLVLWNERESLRDDYKKLKNDFENMKKEHEDLKSSFLEHLWERDQFQLQLNTTEGRLQYLEAISLQITPRTCQTLADLGVTRTGEYFVDPDGVRIGDAPIKVLCDMETDPVSTIVLHDSMENTAIDRCPHPGCYNRSLRYDSSMKQMVALIQQSQSCEQHITYDCFSSALTTGVIHYAWWVDRHGEPQYYWDGSKAGQHKCNCGLSGNCTDTNFPCNCDANTPHWESDKGAITNATALPITELRFGGLQLEGQKANYTLGGLTCKGKIPSPENPAQSCSTLRQAGNGHPGYYMIDSKKIRLDIVMCRMDLEETDQKFQVETSVHIAEESTASLLDVQSTTFHLLKQDAILWPLAGTGKDVVKAMNAVDCGSICHSLRIFCDAFNWYPRNFTCEIVNTQSATLQDAPGAMVYVSASNVCQTPPPSMVNRTMNFSHGWNGRLPAHLLSEVSYDCLRHTRCPPPLPLKAKCFGSDTWEILNLNVTPPCPGSVPLAKGYKLFQEDGRFYKRYSERLNWTEASQVCCLDGARLASDTSPTVYNAIRSVATNTDTWIWQGATDELVEGTWIYEEPIALEWRPRRKKPDGADFQIALHAALACRNINWLAFLVANPGKEKGQSGGEQSRSQVIDFPVLGIPGLEFRYVPG